MLVAPGVRLHVRRFGEPSGRTFLLVHGLSSNARLWDAVAVHLVAAGHDVVAVDLRSHGESDAPDDGYDTATAAADLAALTNELGIKQAVVAGQSWGGDVVVQFAAKTPEPVAALALIDGGWSELRATFDSWESCERALRPPDVDHMPASVLRGHMRTSHPDWSDEAVDATLANLAVNPDGTLTRRLSIPHHMAIVRSMWDDPPGPYYSSIHVPVLLMPALPAESSSRQAAEKQARVASAAAAIADAEVREYRGGDHDLHAQQPNRVAADLLALAGRIR